MNISKCTLPGANRAMVPALLAVVAAALATPAMTGNAVGPDVTVRYADLDVDSAQGAAMLLKRIERAAGHICAALDHGDLASRANRDSCSNKLTADTVAKVNRPALAAAYEHVRRSALPLAALVK